MVKKRKIFKSNALKQVNSGNFDRMRSILVQIVDGTSYFLKRPNELYNFLAKSIDNVETLSDSTNQLEILAWILRTDFLCFKVESEEMEEWESLFYDAATFFVELATSYDDKGYIADLLYDLALRHVGGEGRSVLFLSVNEFLPQECARDLILEIISVVEDIELKNREDILDAICDMSDTFNDCELYAKASLLKDPDKSNATLIDIANSCLVAGNLELAKQWVNDVKNPMNEDEEDYLDLLAAIASKENRKSDCVKIARRLYESYPKVIHLARLCSIVSESESHLMLYDYAKYRSGDGFDIDFLSLLVSMKAYDVLKFYLDLFEKELTTQDAHVLNEISDALEKEGQLDLAKHIRDWTVEEPEEIQKFDNKDE